MSSGTPVTRPIPDSLVVDFNIYNDISTEYLAFQKGDLDAEKTAALEAIPGWHW
jgi:hypothetical protein